MEFNLTGGMPEMHGSPDTGPAFEMLQAQLAHAGIELHRVELDEGRAGYTVAVRGSVRNLDSLAQVASYAKCLGVVVPSR